MTEFKIGDVVECRFLGSHEWKAAHVRGVCGEVAWIQNDAGDFFTRHFAHLRYPILVPVVGQYFVERKNPVRAYLIHAVFSAHDKELVVTEYFHYSSHQKLWASVNTARPFMISGSDEFPGSVYTIVEKLPEELDNDTK